MTRQSHAFDIAIVGAGPVGLVAAACLARQGLTCALVDRQPHGALVVVPDDGREIALSHRSVRLLRQAGVWQHLDAGDMGHIRRAQVLDKSSARALVFDATGTGKPTLATMVANCHIRRAAYAAAQRTDGIGWFCGQGIAQVRTGARGATVVLEDGQSVRTRLVIAADGRFSKLRAAQQIAAEQLDFKRTMIVARATHALPHGDTAYECFLRNRTLAVLPLAGRTSSIVLTVPQALAQTYMDLDRQHFSALVTEWFGARLGAMTLVGARHAYPLVAIYAGRFTAPSFALMGDAAVGMHPVTAHGFNFGLRGVEIMSNLVAHALENGRDFAGAHALAAYDRQLRAATRPLYLATNAIATLYARTGPVSGAVRQALVMAGRHLPAVRHLVERHLVSDAA